MSLSSSFPRRRESSSICSSDDINKYGWIPAFAGMTNKKRE
jgi:hypothetical protein